MNKAKKKPKSESNIFNVGVFSALLSLLLFSFVAVAPSGAQTPAALAAGSYSNSTPGPTATPQSARLLLNTTGTTYATPNTTVQMTASLSNQQYTGSGTGTGNPVVMFGATNNSSGSTPTPRQTYAPMNNIGSPANTQYSNTATGAAGGIDVATNQVFNMYTSVHQWANSSTPSTNNTRIYMAD